MPTRREVLIGGGALATAIAVPWRPAMAAPSAPAPSTPGPSVPAPSTGGKGTVEPVALPFDPTRLPGLSEKLLRSHWENNYGGAVKNLGRTREQIAGLGKDSPPMLAAGLLDKELSFRNSVVLHELYFGNLGGSGAPSGAVATRLADSFGSVARFEELFRLACAGLYGGSGWVVLARDPRTADLRLYASGNHKEAPASAAPLLVCDMYEHSYAIDYGAAAAKYVDAFWSNVDWSVVGERLAQAEGAP